MLGYGKGNYRAGTVWLKQCGMSFLVAVAALAGCYPSPTVLGHGAAVLPAGDMQDATGGGGLLGAADDSGVWPLGYYCGSIRRGVGRRAELEAGHQNLFRVYGGIRYQLVGSPEGGEENRRHAIAVSVDGGGTIAPAGTGGTGALYWGGIASIRCTSSCWYVCYRRYRGVVEDSSDIADIWKDFQQNMVFVGMAMDSGRVVESYYTWTTQLEGQEFTAIAAFGINVLAVRY